MSEAHAVRILRVRREEVVRQLESICEKAGRRRSQQLRAYEVRRWDRLMAEVERLDAAIWEAHR